MSRNCQGDSTDFADIQKRKRACHVGSNETVTRWNVGWEMVIFEQWLVQ